MRVAFIGLGSMGHPMACNLARSDVELVVYNRTRSRAEDLAGLGAAVAGSPREAAEGADCLITMLADDAAVSAVLEGEQGALAGLPRGAVHACMTTISVAFSRRLAERHAGLGQGYVAAPVFGRPDAAAAAKLWVVTGGPKDAVGRCRPAFEAVGQGVLELGEEPGQANSVKLAGNFMLAAMMEAFGEAAAMVDKAGVSPGRFLEVVNGHLFRSPVYENYGGMIAEQRFEPAGFRMRLGLKDMRLLLEAAEASEAPMPMGSLVHDRYLTGVARGYGDQDWSAVSRVARQDAGLTE
ncbi:MAG TPA: NAD(P)-dependent oxidoreductase [Gammaproteobacteria bacterium]|nr:NAD(P)-dependent oxidoreductase [Gammaproteobacteria bacterium]